MEGYAQKQSKNYIDGQYKQCCSKYINMSMPILLKLDQTRPKCNSFGRQEQTDLRFLAKNNYQGYFERAYWKRGVGFKRNHGYGFGDRNQEKDPNLKFKIACNTRCQLIILSKGLKFNPPSISNFKSSFDLARRSRKIL